MKMQGYNGSQLWDTAFTVQAYVATGLHNNVSKALYVAHMYMKNSQIIEEAGQPLSRYYRHISKGAWPFSNRDHGWPISDCTGEACHLSLHSLSFYSVFLAPLSSKSPCIGHSH
jgi:cycloartenol synthase